MYSTEIDGETTEFGTSGMLYRSNKLMYDRATETLWHQFRGEPVVGPLAGSGIRLDILPNVLTTWGEWLAAHPDTTVISNETGVYPADSYRPEWDMASIYFSYRADPGTMFPVAGIDDSLPVKEQVFGLAFNGAAKAYPRRLLADAPILHDAVGGRNVVILTNGFAGGPRAYDRGDRIFQGAASAAVMGQPDAIEDDSGNLWAVLEDALVMNGNPRVIQNRMRLERLPSRDAYWFGWQAFYPHTEIWQP